MKYCKDLFSYSRRKTREVMVGDVGVGGDNPIRVQSMTIADTMDTEATVAEVIQLVEAGCEIVRITAPSINEAANLAHIKAGLNKRGLRVPLVADIHFTPNAAMIAAEHVEKIRINPGNYADKKRFEQRDYTDAEYQHELLRIEEKFKPLVLKCKERGRAMRIGTNHGSLSDRIMNRYGDTAEGMVESALEFVRICEKYDYHDIILSMKSSNPQVAIQAYRLLAAKMDTLGMDYPFHLGVTEAGDGGEGRIKSAVGIGALLEDGIGDTIRVSLTEDAVHEVPVAFKLVEKFNRGLPECSTGIDERLTLNTPHPFEYSRRPAMSTDLVYHKIGGSEIPRVEFPVKNGDLGNPQQACVRIGRMLGKNLNGELQMPGNTNGKRQPFEVEWLHVSPASADELRQVDVLKGRMRSLGLYVPFAVDITSCGLPNDRVARFAGRLVQTISPGLENAKLEAVVLQAKRFGKALEFKIKADDEDAYRGLERGLQEVLEICKVMDYWRILFSIQPADNRPSIVGPYRYLAARLDALQANLPLLLRYSGEGDFETQLVQAASQLGSLLCDGIGDSIFIDIPASDQEILELSYNILQATRTRISKTDYISCPSCGRTLFNLQTTTERIKSKTDHLKGVKIAIMGCIVNGPGEMADADFGYVGAGPKRVNLFVGKECVERNIPENVADNRLIALIKSEGMWVEPE
jgi:(E)-4-hydroxy-3-methylbut-2-enyl-diphosphate synthase